MAKCSTSALVGSWRRRLLGMLHSCYHLTPAPPPTGSSLSFPRACARHHPWDRYLDVCSHEEEDTVNIQIPQKPWEALSACRTTRDQYRTMHNTHKHRVLKNNSLMAMLLSLPFHLLRWCWYVLFKWRYLTSPFDFALGPDWSDMLLSSISEGNNYGSDVDWWKDQLTAASLTSPCLGRLYLVN